MPHLRTAVRINVVNKIFEQIHLFGLDFVEANGRIRTAVETLC